MPQIRLECPFCSTRERMEVDGPIKAWIGNDLRRADITTNLTQGGLTVTAVASCPECRLPFGIVIIFASGKASHHLFQASTNDAADASLVGGHVGIARPPARLARVDETLPVRVREVFQEIEEDAQKRRNAVGILSGARGCLDVALKALGEVEGGRRQRIDRLADQGLITKGIATWSHRLWKEGSDAVHDLSASIDEAIEHVAFLRLFFEVAFALPGRIARASSTDVNGEKATTEG